MFMRAKRRFKDGKEHRYWSVVENCRNRDGRVVQRQVLYLGEINDSQRAAWCRSIEVLQGDCGPAPMALFPDDREAPELTCETVRIHVNELSVHRPRQWGGCWLALTLWDRLERDRFWAPRLSPSRQGTRWLDVLKTQVCYPDHRGDVACSDLGNHLVGLDLARAKWGSDAQIEAVDLPPPGEARAPMVGSVRPIVDIAAEIDALQQIVADARRAMDALDAEARITPDDARWVIPAPRADREKTPPAKPRRRPRRGEIER